MNIFEELAGDLFDKAEKFNKYTEDKTTKKALNMFYRVMRKHGIKKYSPSQNGAMIGNNYAWTMCMDYFFSTINARRQIETIFTDPPKDLMCYKK